MPRNKDIKKVLVIGSGPIVIGQAAEFDYAGTQACRSLKEEGVEVCLTSASSKRYLFFPFTPISPYFIKKALYIIHLPFLMSCIFS